MSIEFETIADNCTPRNALFCCRSPVCLNNSPKLVPVSSNAAMDAQYHEQSKVFPVRVPDLSDAGFYTSLMTQPSANLCNHIQSNESNSATTATTAANAAAATSSSSKPVAADLHGVQSMLKMNEIDKSQSAQDMRTYGVSLRRVTPPKSTVAVKKSDNPMMNVVLRKVYFPLFLNKNAFTTGLAALQPLQFQCKILSHTLSLSSIDPTV